MAGFGIDFSSGSGLTTTQMHANGVTFVARYISTPGNPKNISKLEFDNYMRAGIKVTLVFETSAGRILGGFGAGQADARSAQSQVSALGASTIPVYFACDFDATPGQQAAINSYLDGVASVIGRARTGIYGGYYPTSRAFKAGKARYVWQTYAWSGSPTLWDRPNTHIEQYSNDRIMGPAHVDFDRSMQTDFGQWPRPSSPAPDPTPQPIDGGKAFRHVADGTYSLAAYARKRNTTVDAILEFSKSYLSDDHYAALSSYIVFAEAFWRSWGSRPFMPKDLVFYTRNA